MVKMRFFLPFWIVFLSLNVYSKDKINLLTWWEYITPQDTAEIEKLCGVELSVDEYYSNTEFLRRWDDKKQSHDIIIYSNTIHGLISNNVSRSSSGKIKVPSYFPSLEGKIKELLLPTNTRVFMMSLTGFLTIGPEQKMNLNTPFDNLLNNSKDKIFVIMDDSVEGIGVLQKMNFLSESLEKFDDKKIRSINSKIIITNDLATLIEDKRFSLAYVWSGSALQSIKTVKNKKLNFQIYPQLSHVTADLISMVTNSKPSECVFRHFSSKEFLARKQNLTNYFSPYGGLSSLSDENFKQFYEKYFHMMPNYFWLKSPNVKDFYTMDETWKKLKLIFNK